MALRCDGELTAGSDFKSAALSNWAEPSVISLIAHFRDAQQLPQAASCPPGVDSLPPRAVPAPADVSVDHFPTTTQHRSRVTLNRASRSCGRDANPLVCPGIIILTSTHLGHPFRRALEGEITDEKA